AVKLAEEADTIHRLGQSTLAHTIDFQINSFDIDADNRNTAAHGAWQHKSIAVETYSRCTVTHIDIKSNRCFNHFTDRSRQTRADTDAVIFTMLQTFNTDLLFFGFQTFRACIINRYERSVIN